MPGPFLSSKPSAVWVTVVLPMRVVIFSVFKEIPPFSDAAFSKSGGPERLRGFACRARL